MVRGLLSAGESEDGGSESGNRPASPFPYAKVFYKQFPYYLSIGMTEEQYWDKDCCLVKYYREAEEIRKERFNQEAWLQGMYVYDAIIRISPVLHAFAKKGTKARPYVEQAYPINTQMVDESKTRKERLTSEKGIRYMQAFMVKNNKRFEERK